MLTPAERSVLHLLRHGLSNAQIARLRRTSAVAVEYHLGNIVGNVGVRGRAALRRWDGVPVASASDREDHR